MWLGFYKKIKEYLLALLKGFSSTYLNDFCSQTLETNYAQNMPGLNMTSVLQAISLWIHVFLGHKYSQHTH